MTFVFSLVVGLGAILSGAALTWHDLGRHACTVPEAGPGTPQNLLAAQSMQGQALLVI